MNHYENLIIKVTVTHICVSITQEPNAEGSWEPRSLRPAWAAEHDPVSVNQLIRQTGKSLVQVKEKKRKIYSTLLKNAKADFLRELLLTRQYYGERERAQP